MVKDLYRENQNEADFLAKINDQLPLSDPATAVDAGNRKGLTVDLPAASQESLEDFLNSEGFSKLGTILFDLDGNTNWGRQTTVNLQVLEAFASEGDEAFDTTKEEPVFFKGTAFISLHSDIDILTFEDGSTQSAGSTTNNLSWHVTSAVFTQSFDVSTEDGTMLGLFFRADGLKLYGIGNNTNDVFEYDLTTAWDISTASINQNLDTTSEDSAPQDIVFKPDGLRMYVLGNNGNDVNEYTLTVAWDISTATFTQLFNTTTEEGTPLGLFFKPDGLAMYVSGTGAGLTQYSLSIAWDVTTASFVQSFDVTVDEATPQDVFFKPDGTLFYIVGSGDDEVKEYTVSTPWDISTTKLSDAFSVDSQDATPAGVVFKPDGTRMYFVGTTNDNIYEYALGISTASIVTNIVRTGRLGFAVTSDTSDLGIAEIYACTDTTAARTLTISTSLINLGSTSNPLKIIIKDESGGAGAFNITIETEGSELIDGVASIIIAVNFGGVILYSNGSNLFSLGTT